MATYARRHPDVELVYQRELEDKARVRELIRSNFAFMRGSDPDLYRAFAELAIRISRPRGAIGMVYPRMLLAADGSKLYRTSLFPQARIVADFALNRGGWIFPDAEHRYTIVALSARKDGSGTIAQAGPAVNEKRWSMLPDIRTHWRYAELERFSDGVELPLLEDEREQALYTKMMHTGQPFSAEITGARFRPWAPIHETNDRKSGLLRVRGRGISGWPVYGGLNFYLWEPEIGETEFVCDPRQGVAVLQRKRLRSRVWAGAPAAVLRDVASLPPNRCSILFRDVARATDSRTILACLVPPGRFAHNKAPILVQLSGSERDAALRLAVMCSLPFDWAARRRIETNVNFFILNALPVPRVGPGTALSNRAIELAARLACSDARFAPFADACSVATGSLQDESARYDAIAELDAVAAAMYGLDSAELEIVFEDFTLDAVPPGHRNAVRRHFERLIERAA